MMEDAEVRRPRGDETGSGTRVTRIRRRVSLALAGMALLGIVFSAGLLSYEVMRPAEPEAPASVAVNVGRWRGDPGAVYDRTPITPTPSPTPPPTPRPVPPALETIPYQMTIDRIGVNAPVVAKGMDANRVPIVPLNSYQVAWYSFSAQPGTGGNAVFAGHVTWSGRAVFYSLDLLALGDVIRLDAGNGDQFTYTVTEAYTVAEDDPEAPKVMGPTSNDVITIITCDGEFYYTGDPVSRGSYTGRRIVRAELTSRNVVAAIGADASGG